MNYGLVGENCVRKSLAGIEKRSFEVGRVDKKKCSTMTSVVFKRLYRKKILAYSRKLLISAITIVKFQKVLTKNVVTVVKKTDLFENFRK